MDKKRETKISKLQNSGEAELCASMMSGSEPWMTLKRDRASLKIMNGALW